MTRSTLLTLSLSGVLLLTTGCTGQEEPSARPEPESVASSAAPSPTGVPAQAELIAALERTQRAAYRFTVRGDLPENSRIQGSGAFDPKARKFESTIKVTGGESPAATQRIVIGTDSYLRPVGRTSWVRLDLKRVKAGTPAHFDMTDPTGLVKFTSMIKTVERTGPHAYTGLFDPNQDGIAAFLPVGAPAIVSLAMGRSRFTITTDAQGWVTSISVELVAGTGPKLAMKTTFSGHGKPLKTKAPPKANTQEAADFYYDS